MRQYDVYDLRPFKFVEVCFKVQNMACVLYVLYTLEKNAYADTVEWTVL